MAQKRMKETKSAELNLIWNDLQDIFLSYKKLNNKIIDQLEKLGFECRINKNHLMLYMYINGKKYSTSISSTPSDTYAGSMILKQIRRIYENAN